jgi:hypothetical protein
VPNVTLSGRVARFFSLQHTKNWTNIPNNHKIYQMAKYVRNSHKIEKWPYKLPTSSIGRPSKIYTNRDFWFKNICLATPLSGMFSKFTLSKLIRLGTAFMYLIIRLALQGTRTESQSQLLSLSTSVQILEVIFTRKMSNFNGYLMNLPSTFWVFLELSETPKTPKDDKALKQNIRVKSIQDSKPSR